jgi:hypothetical protein
LALYDEVYELVREGRLDAAEVYGEIQYRAGSWPYARRVVVRIEKPYGSFCAHATFIVTNMVDASPEDVFKFYHQRGAAENLIKEAINRFDFGKTPSREMNVNACRMLLKGDCLQLLQLFQAARSSREHVEHDGGHGKAASLQDRVENRQARQTD